MAERSAVFLLVFPALPHSGFTMATMIQFLMFSVYGMGWNTIGGYGGQVDLGKAQYVGIGAYTTAVMMIRWDVPFWVSLPDRHGSGSMLELHHRLSVVPAERSLLCHRNHSDFLGPQRLVRVLVVHRRGQGAARSPSKGHAELSLPPVPAGLLLLLHYPGLLFCRTSLHELVPSQPHRVSNSVPSKTMRTSPAASGIDAHWAKIRHMRRNRFVAAVGSFHACYNFNIEPEDVMGLDLSILIALMAMLGGAGSLFGPIIGAAILVPMKNYLGAWFGATAGLVGLDLIIYSTIIMLIAALEPRGIWGMITRLRQRAGGLMSSAQSPKLGNDFWWVASQLGHFLSVGRRRDARPYRAQRRGQIDAVQLHARDLRPDCGQDILSRPGCNRLQTI